MNINYWNHIESMAVVDGTQQIFPKNILSLFDFLNLRPVYPMNQSYAINSRDSLVIFFKRHLDVSGPNACDESHFHRETQPRLRAEGWLQPGEQKPGLGLGAVEVIFTNTTLYKIIL